METGRPVVQCFASYPLNPFLWSEPDLVTLEEAARLRAEGWIIVGPDPGDMIALALWEKEQEQQTARKHSSWFA